MGISRRRIKAIVFSQRRCGEADRIVTLFSRERGFIHGIAKGVRRLTSRRAGHLEPFTNVHVLVTEGSSGMYITAAETLEYYDGLRKDEEAFSHAQNIALVIPHLIYEHDPQPYLYDTVERAFLMLPSLPVQRRYLVEAATLLEIVCRAGLTPDFSSCHVCGKQRCDDAAILDFTNGGWRCISCHGGFIGSLYSLPPVLLKVIRYIAVHPNHAHAVRASGEESYQIMNAVRSAVADIVEKPIFAHAQRKTYG